MDSFDQARQNEDRGTGIPLTDEERAERHYSQYGTTDLPPRGTGLGGITLQSLDLLKNIGSSPTTVPKGEIIGLIAGGVLGYFFARRFPNFIVKYIGAIFGAEVGVILARVINSRRSTA